MRIVSKKRIVDFYTIHPSSRTALEDWYQKSTKAVWEHLNDFKTSFPSADYVGNNWVIFNIKGNDYRLVAIVIYASQKVYVRWIGTHAAYDRIDPKNV